MSNGEVISNYYQNNVLILKRDTLKFNWVQNMITWIAGVGLSSDLIHGLLREVLVGVTLPSCGQLLLSPEGLFRLMQRSKEGKHKVKDSVLLNSVCERRSPVTSLCIIIL